MSVRINATVTMVQSRSALGNDNSNKMVLDVVRGLNAKDSLDLKPASEKFEEYFPVLGQITITLPAIMVGSQDEILNDIYAAAKKELLNHPDVTEFEAGGLCLKDSAADKYPSKI